MKVRQMEKKWFDGHEKVFRFSEDGEELESVAKEEWKWINQESCEYCPYCGRKNK